MSDLHFGSGFDNDKWEDVKAVCSKAGALPDLVIITGDIVNHPWKKSIIEAAAALKTFQEELERISGKKIPFLYVPGNHDARIYGLFPLYWLYGLAGLALIVCLSLFTRFFADSHPYLGSLLFLLPVIPLIVRSRFAADLSVLLKDMLITTVYKNQDVGIGVIPLDSSRAWTYGAHGSVPNSMIRLIRQANNDPSLFWIAAVHHHPLPIPTDHFAERSMILKNSGTVLRNLIEFDIPIILHGHKHHQHFSRFFLATKEGEKEIAVVSAGTPTHARNPSRAHSFNIIRVSTDKRAKVSVYEAEAGIAFDDKRTYFVSEGDTFRRRQFKTASTQCDISAEKMICAIFVDDFGNSVWSEEFIGVKARHDTVDFPYDFGLTCKKGHIAGGKGYLSGGVGVDTRFSYTSEHAVCANVEFVPRLLTTDNPINYRVEFHVQNFCALDTHQYDHMYTGEDDYLGYMEYVNFETPQCVPVRSLSISIVFPDRAFPSKFVLRGGVNGGSLDLGRIHDAEIVPIAGNSAVIVTIHAPNAGWVYQLSWRVIDWEEKNGNGAAVLHSRLMRLSRDTENNQALIQSYFTQIVVAAVEAFIKQSQLLGDVDCAVSVFACDRRKNVLTKLLGTSNDTMRGTCFTYGLGLAGMAMKSRATTFCDIGMRTIYLPIKGPRTQAFSAEFDDITSEVGNSLAVPIYSLEDIDETSSTVVFKGNPYAVVKVAFLGDGVTNAFDISNSFVQTTFSVAASKLMYKSLQAAILQP